MTTSVWDFTPCQHYMCTFAKQFEINLASYRKSPSTPAKYECSWHRTNFTVLNTIGYRSLLLQRREFPASSDRIRTRQPQPPQQRWPRRLPPPGSCFSKTSLIETRFKVKCIHWWTLWRNSSFCPHPSISEVTKTTSTSSSARKPSLKATFFFQLHCNCISLEIQHPPWQAFFDIFWYVLIIGKDSWQMLTPLNTVCMASIDGFYKLHWLVLLHSVNMSWSSCGSVLFM